MALVMVCLHAYLSSNSRRQGAYVETLTFARKHQRAVRSGPCCDAQAHHSGLPRRRPGREGRVAAGLGATPLRDGFVFDSRCQSITAKDGGKLSFCMVAEASLYGGPDPGGRVLGAAGD